MEAQEGKRRKMIEETVIQILKASDFETATEFSIRTITAQRLGVDRFDLDQKRLIRALIESFLLSSESRTQSETAARVNKRGESNGAQESEMEARGTDSNKGAARGTNGDVGNGVQELEMAARGTYNGDFDGVQSSDAVLGSEVQVKQEHHQEGGGGGGDCFQNANSRIICELSQSRKVSVHDFRGQSMVTIQDYYKKNGKQFPKNKGTSLNAEQWLTIKNHIPSIEEAITRMQSRLRLQAAGKPSDSYVSRPVVDSALANVTEYNKQMDSIHSAQESVLEGSKQMEVESILPPSGLMDMPVRLDGTNYYLWKHQMEFVLTELKVVYVLTEPCPSISPALSGTHEGTDEAKASAEKWVDDDYICRHKILTCLCDNLYNDYSRKACYAKELWNKLKSVYDEDIGTRRSQIHKYVQFQIVDGVSILEQVLELQSIAHSICASGTWIEEYFHVSLIISKLPPSWKEFRLRMMRKEVLPLPTLMECLKVEEDACIEKQLGKPSWHSAGSKCESKVVSQSRETKKAQWKHKGKRHCPKGAQDSGFHG